MGQKNRKDILSVTDESLMQLAAGGDRLAFEFLYDRYFNKLVWFAKGFLSDDEKARDVIQDVFIKIAERPDLYKSENKFSTWVYTITSNQCRNVLRNEKNRDRLLKENYTNLQSMTNEQQSQFDRRLLRQQIENAIENLSPKEKSLFSLRFEEEMSIRDISTVVQIPEGSVKSGIFHLLKKVSKQLKEFRYETK